MVIDELKNSKIDAMYHSLQENDLKRSKKLHSTAIKAKMFTQKGGIQRGHSCKRTLGNSKNRSGKVGPILVYSSSKV